MHHSRPSSNNITYNGEKGYKICAAKDCTRLGINPLKILYVNRIGWFCTVHKEEFLTLGIIEPVCKNEEVFIDE